MKPMLPCVACGLAVSLLTVLVTPVEAQTFSPCWSSNYNFASCCLVGAAHCFDETFTYERCCLQEPLFSQEEATQIQKVTDQDIACGCDEPLLVPPGYDGKAFNWCKYRQAVMLNQDLRPFYVPFTQIDLQTLASCPAGALAMFLFDAYLKLSNSPERPSLGKMPSFLRAEAAFEGMLRNGKLTLSGIADSGWMIYFQMSGVRSSALRRGGAGAAEATRVASHPCLEVPAPGSASSRILQSLVGVVEFKSIGPTAGLRLLLSGQDDVMPRCGLARAALALSQAYSAHQYCDVPEEELSKRVPGTAPGPGEEARMLRKLGDEWAMEELTPAKSPLKILALLVATPWPMIEVLELLSHNGRVMLTVDQAMKRLMGLPADHLLLMRALSAPKGNGPQAHRRQYVFRVNPYREMVSDMVRYTKLPFCGLRPFMRMVADVARAGIEAGCPAGKGAESASLCEFSFVEGGPHLGDCALWAATALGMAGVQLKAIAFEPLPDASALFAQSVAENGYAGRVSVRPAAMGERGGEPVELIYFHGHNGQATVNGAEFPSQNRQEVSTVMAPQVALDDELPATWPLLDSLKLSVNGAERNTLAGARRLLSQRRICSVLMHATKCKRGRRPPSEDPAPGDPTASKFSHELMQYLHEGNLDVFEHNDADEGTPGAGRVRPLVSARDMDNVFDDPELTEQVYFLAISKEQQCSRAQRHFHAAADRPPGSQLEDPGRP
mmetsp:Transcript_64660/g.115014  ORF Transcript_64660/g.115014 Transcript_64660/m.115014 type:complete len:723 (-) Transcript_64660:62-2230(-)